MDQPIKKKPGRPKKQTQSTAQLLGITSNPQNPEHVVEFVYTNSAVFKKILTLYVRFNVSEIELYFGLDGLIIGADDHLGKSTICTRIDGKCVAIYYCAAPLKLSVTRANLSNILTNIGKNNSKVQLVLCKSDFSSKMYLSISDSEYGNNDEYSIDISYNPHNQIPLMLSLDDEDYPIIFNVSAKHFKSKMLAIKSVGKHFVIQKEGRGALKLTHDYAQNVNWVGTYNDPKKIGLKSKLLDDDIFHVSVSVEYVMPFAKNIFGETVVVAVDKTKRISFSSAADPTDHGFACVVKIYTEILGYRGT